MSLEWVSEEWLREKYPVLDEGTAVDQRSEDVGEVISQIEEIMNAATRSATGIIRLGGFTAGLSNEPQVVEAMNKLNQRAQEILDEVKPPTEPKIIDHDPEEYPPPAHVYYGEK